MSKITLEELSENFDTYTFPDTENMTGQELARKVLDYLLKFQAPGFSFELEGFKSLLTEQTASLVLDGLLTSSELIEGFLDSAIRSLLFEDPDLSDLPNFKEITAYVEEYLPSLVQTSRPSAALKSVVLAYNDENVRYRKSLPENHMSLRTGNLPFEDSKAINKLIEVCTFNEEQLREGAKDPTSLVGYPFNIVAKLNKPAFKNAASNPWDRADEGSGTDAPVESLGTTTIKVAGTIRQGPIPSGQGRASVGAAELERRTEVSWNPNTRASGLVAPQEAPAGPFFVVPPQTITSCVTLTKETMTALVAAALDSGALHLDLPQYTSKDDTGRGYSTKLSSVKTVDGDFRLEFEMSPVSVEQAAEEEVNLSKLWDKSPSIDSAFGNYPFSARYHPDDVIKDFE